MPLNKQTTIEESVLLLDIGGTLVKIGEDFEVYTHRAIESIHPFFNTRLSKDVFVQRAMAIRNDIRRKAHDSLVEYPFDYYIQQVIAGTGAGIKCDIHTVEEQYINAECSITSVFEDTETFLRRAKDHGRKIIAATNNFSSLHVQRLLNDFGIQGYFDQIYVSGTMKIRKPSPAFVDTIITSEHLDKNDCVLIGDKPEMDVLAGINAGLRTVWLNRKGAKTGINADTEVSSLDALNFSD